LAAPILVVTGLAREAACVAGDGVTTICSGADVSLLRVGLEKSQDADFSCVVSFGLAGGLDYALRPGDVLVGAEAVAGGRRHPTHKRLASVLTEGFATAGLNASLGVVAGVDRPIMDLRAKSALREATSASAVDMESHVAGEYAEARQLPFAIVRAISDPAARALPRLAASAIKPDGSVDLVRVVSELARAPGQIGDLVLAGLDARAAFASLGRCGALLGPLLRLVLADL
jgi:hopanoid-associated phosphorylase